MRALRKSGLTLVAALLSIGATADAAGEFSTGCLYATTVDKKPIPLTSCADADPLELGKNVDVRKAMTALRIPFDRVRFKGCTRQPFAVYLDATGIGNAYVVTYASEQRATFLAPVLHELAHVLQMEAAGGPTQLRDQVKLSKRIELGADYLTGVLFARNLPDAPLKLFEQNLLLTGLYYEQNDRAHGTPTERKNAFRFGTFAKPEEIDGDLRQVSANFQRNIYGEVVAGAR
jgi:hypothetical protein